jgi:hypothetical protein
MTTQFSVSWQDGNASAFDISPSFPTKRQAIAWARTQPRRPQSGIHFAIFHRNVCVHEE